MRGAAPAGRSPPAQARAVAALAIGCSSRHGRFRASATLPPRDRSAASLPPPARTDKSDFAHIPMDYKIPEEFANKRD